MEKENKIMKTTFEKERAYIFMNAINYIRTTRNLSMRQLGNVIGFSAMYISDLENGNRLPTLEVIRRFKETLVLSEEEDNMLIDGYKHAHPSIPLDIMYYIIDNDLIEPLTKLKEINKDGSKIKELVIENK